MKRTISQFGKATIGLLPERGNRFFPEQTIPSNQRIYSPNGRVQFGEPTTRPSYNIAGDNINTYNQMIRTLQDGTTISATIIRVRIGTPGAIQRAIDNAKLDASATKRYVIVVPSGIYDEALTHYSNISLVGEGLVILKNTAGAGNIITYADITNCQFENLTLQPTVTNAKCLNDTSVTSSTGLKFNDLTIDATSMGGACYGLYMLRTTKSSSFNCSFLPNPAYTLFGYYFQSTAETSLNIYNPSLQVAGTGNAANFLLVNNNSSGRVSVHNPVCRNTGTFGGACGILQEGTGQTMVYGGFMNATNQGTNTAHLKATAGTLFAFDSRIYCDSNSTAASIILSGTANFYGYGIDSQNDNSYAFAILSGWSGSCVLGGKFDGTGSDIYSADAETIVDVGIYLVNGTHTNITLTPTHNADTVDGFHANATATASNILPLDASKNLPMDGKVTGLSVPTTNGDTIRQTTKITEVLLESATDLKHTQGTDTALGALSTKNPPIDADKAIYRDSTASDALVTSTWTQVKAFLKTYFDTLYSTASADLLDKAIYNVLITAIKHSRESSQAMQVLRDGKYVTMQSITDDILSSVGLTYNAGSKYWSASSLDLLQEEWDAMGSWSVSGSGTAEISPAGELHIVPAAGNFKRVYKDIGSLPEAGYTNKFPAYYDSLGTVASDNIFDYQWFDGVHNIAIRGGTDKIRCYNSAGGWTDFTVTTAEDTQYYWLFKIDSSGHSVAVYRSTSATILSSDLLTTFTDLAHDVTIDGTVMITHMRYASGGGESHHKYNYIATGLYTPEQFDALIAGSGTLIGNALTVSAVPTTLYMVGVAIDADDDCVWSVSRDGGTTFSTITMTDIGNLVNIVNSSIYIGKVAVSGQPSGSSVKWRVVTGEGADQIYCVGIIAV